MTSKRFLAFLAIIPTILACSGNEKSTSLDSSESEASSSLLSSENSSAPFVYLTPPKGEKLPLYYSDGVYAYWDDSIMLQLEGKAGEFFINDWSHAVYAWVGKEIAEAGVVPTRPEDGWYNGWLLMSIYDEWRFDQSRIMPLRHLRQTGIQHDLELAFLRSFFAPNGQLTSFWGQGSDTFFYTEIEVEPGATSYVFQGREYGRAYFENKTFTWAEDSVAHCYYSAPYLPDGPIEKSGKEQQLWLESARWRGLWNGFSLWNLDTRDLIEALPEAVEISFGKYQLEIIQESTSETKYVHNVQFTFDEEKMHLLEATSKGSFIGGREDFYFVPTVSHAVFSDFGKVKAHIPWDVRPID